MELEVKDLKALYPNLASEIAKRGIKKCVIASTIGISSRAFYNKMSGLVPFTWPETCAIRDTFFPDMNKDTLFAKSDDRNSA